MSQRIMLIGATGQVGRALQETHRPDEWVFDLVGHQDLDITSAASVRHIIQTHRPDFIINAAGSTNVDRAQKNEDEAMAVNFEGPASIAAQCSALDIPLLHLSTDYVFDGRDTTPYAVEAQMNPVNIYGYSKMMGEEAVRHELAWHVILRISSVFSGIGNNLLTKTLSLINTQPELRMVNDQHAAPTPAHDVAEAIVKITTQILNGKTNGFGTFHFCGSTPCTRYDFTQTVMEVYAPFTDKRPKITPVASEVFADFAPRPAYSVMECTKIQQAYGLAQPDWREALLPCLQRAFKENGAG